jgi:hypothetical protein
MERGALLRYDPTTLYLGQGKRLFAWQRRRIPNQLDNDNRGIRRAIQSDAALQGTSSMLVAKRTAQPSKQFRSGTEHAEYGLSAEFFW